MAKEDEEIRRMLVELRLLEGSARTLESRLAVVDTALSEIVIASSTLEGIKNKPKGTEALIPVGAGSFIRVELADSEKIVMGVGAGVSLEKSVNDSIESLKDRQDDLEKLRASLQQQLSQIASRIDDERRTLSDLVKKRGGETVEVV
jgi:prefoldin alpha subunit